MISVKIRGIKNLNKDFEKKIKENLENIKDIRVKEIVSSLQDATPVDTGNARAGWHYENSAIVNDVEYIDILNQGTSKQAPSNFIEKTLLAQKNVLPNGVIVKTN